MEGRKGIKNSYAARDLAITDDGVAEREQRRLADIEGRDGDGAGAAHVQLCGALHGELPGTAPQQDAAG